MPKQPPLNPDALGRMFATAMMEVLDAEKLQPGDRLVHVNDVQEVLNRLEKNILAAALPEVTSVEELEALPEGTILRDSYGLALHKRTANWWVTNCDSNLTSEDLADEIADTAHTYTVLYRPEVKP